jgi:hypothetical protein
MTSAVSWMETNWGSSSLYRLLHLRPIMVMSLLRFSLASVVANGLKQGERKTSECWIA